MAEPDLRRIYNAVMDAGKRVSRLSGNGFRSACPAHNGNDLNVTWKQQPSGKISFTCYSHDCSMKDMMESLDLVTTDFIPERELRKPVYEPSYDECLLAVAQGARARGERLSRADREKERQALMRLKRREYGHS